MARPTNTFTPPPMAPVRPMPSPRWFIAIAFSLPVSAGALTAFLNGAAGWRMMPEESVVLFSILAIVGLAALAVGFYRQFKPGAQETMDGRGALTVLVAGFLAFAAVEFGWHPQGDSAVMAAWHCLRLGTLVALSASLLLLLWARKGYAVNPVSASFWTGTLASMAGLIALGLHCPRLELSHQLIAHASMIVVSCYLVSFLARRVFGLR